MCFQPILNLCFFSGAEVLIPFPSYYREAFASRFRRDLKVPKVGSVEYEPLCSDPRWYQRLTTSSNVVCLASEGIADGVVDLVALVRAYLQESQQLAKKMICNFELHFESF